MGSDFWRINICIKRCAVAGGGPLVEVPRKAPTKLLSYCYRPAVVNEPGCFKPSLITELGNQRTLLAVVLAHNPGTVFFPAYKQSGKRKGNETAIEV